jgi:hypothetical protein
MVRPTPLFNAAKDKHGASNAFDKMMAAYDSDDEPEVLGEVTPEVPSEEEPEVQPEVEPAATPEVLKGLIDMRTPWREGPKGKKVSSPWFQSCTSLTLRSISAFSLRTTRRT